VNQGGREKKQKEPLQVPSFGGCFKMGWGESNSAGVGGEKLLNFKMLGFGGEKKVWGGKRRTPKGEKNHVKKRSHNKLVGFTPTGNSKAPG